MTSPVFAEPRAAYLHVPFCVHRCGYCDFTLLAGRDDLAGEYLRAMELELRQLEQPRELDTLFFGGGTPTHLAEDELARLLKLAREWFRLAPGYEFSVEANPAGLTDEKLRLLAEAGVNVDMIIQNMSQSGLTDISFTIPRVDIKKALPLIQDVAKSVEAKSVAVTEAIAKVSLVGVGMRSHSGVAAKMFEVLSQEGVNILMISTSEIKISCVIDEKYVELAMRSLHTAFGLDQPPAGDRSVK